MPFQPPHYEYPLQTTFKDPVGSAIKGISQGLALYAQFQGAKKLSNQDQLTQDIGKAHDMTQAEIAALEKPAEPALTNVQMPNQNETIKKMMVTDQTAQNNAVPGLATYNNNQVQTTGTPQIAADPRLDVAGPQQEAAPLANVQTEKAIADNEAARMKYDKDMADYQAKVIQLRSKMANDIIDLHYKHGFPEEAQKMESKYIEQAANVAKFIDPKLAEKVWNNSSLAEKWGKATIEDKEKWKLSSDGLRAINEKTGETRDIPMTANDALKMFKPVAEGAMGFVPLIGKNNEIVGISFQKNPKDNTRELKKDERESKKEARQDIKDNLTTSGQYYKDLRVTANAYITDNEGSTDPEVAVMVQKYKSVLQKLPDYERFDRDHITRGMEPVNANKIQSFLEGQQPPAKTNRKPLSSFNKGK